MKNPGELGPNGENWTDWEQFVLIENGPDVVISLHTFTYEGVLYSGLITGSILQSNINFLASGNIFLPHLILLACVLITLVKESLGET